jgi:hypothetical protein
MPTVRFPPPLAGCVPRLPPHSIWPCFPQGPHTPPPHRLFQGCLRTIFTIALLKSLSRFFFNLCNYRLGFFSFNQLGDGLKTLSLFYSKLQAFVLQHFLNFCLIGLELPLLRTAYVSPYYWPGPLPPLTFPGTASHSLVCSHLFGLLILWEAAERS